MVITYPTLVTSDRQDLFSTAYVEAIAAMAGYNWSFPRLDRNKTDIAIEHKKDRQFAPSWQRLSIQLKCTYDEDARPRSDGFIHYSLDSDTYETMRNSGEPHILVVVLVPHQMDGCVEMADKSMILRERAYWISLHQAPELPSNQQSKVVLIPVLQEFTVDSLHQLMRDISIGKKP